MIQWLALAAGCLYAAVVGKAGGETPVLLYRTTDQMTTAVAYDSEGDAPVELVQLGTYGPSVLRRVTGSGGPGAVVWRVDGETLCPGHSCSVDLAYSPDLGGYVVKVSVGTGRGQSPNVFVVASDSDVPHLVARATVASTRDYPEQDSPAAGVLAFSRIISADSVSGSRYLFITGSRRDDGEGISTYGLRPDGVGGLTRLEGRVLGGTGTRLLVTQGTKGWRTEESALPNDVQALTGLHLVSVAEPHIVKILQVGSKWMSLSDNGRLAVYSGDVMSSSAAVNKVEPERVVDAVAFKGCGDGATTIVGAWATRHGTFVVAVDDAVSANQHGTVVYNGSAHCLFEIR
jgi:hypothetical protein